MAAFVRLKLDGLLAHLRAELALALDARKAEAVTRPPLRHLIRRDLRVDGGEQTQSVLVLAAVCCGDSDVQHLRDVERWFCH